MRKSIALLTACIMMSALLVGCGKSSAPAEVSADVAALGSDLRNKITYQDDLAEMDIDTASMFINFGSASIVNSSIYESSGATAEEIVVLECASSDDAKKAADAFKTRVAEQKESFENYVPEELTKLGNAVIATSGKYAVLSVSDDADTAKKIISDYLK